MRWGLGKFALADQAQHNQAALNTAVRAGIINVPMER